MRFLTALLACFLALPALAKQPTIYVTRHYDTPAGERDPDLLPAGKARADRLAKALAGKRIAIIYVTDYKRTRQTAAPLAAARSIPVEIYDARDTPGIVARAKAAKRPVLIVGHSNTVPDIVEQLGGKRPADLKHEDFGELWTIRGAKAASVLITP
jgi:broad specificity phosphatase PhoE